MSPWSHPGTQHLVPAPGSCSGRLAQLCAGFPELGSSVPARLQHPGSAGPGQGRPWVLGGGAGWVPWVGAGRVSWVPWMGAPGGLSLSPLPAHPQLLILSGPLRFGIFDARPGLPACPQPREVLGSFHPAGSRFPGCGCL